MSIKKFIADADTTITNAFETSLISRAYYANMGASDALEYFSIYGQVGESIEKSRILVKFPISEISSSRVSGALPSSGSVSFFLKLSNVKHPFSLPENYDIKIVPVSSSWDEGIGLDMDDYSDKGISGSTGRGCNWKFRQLNTTWENEGGDFIDNELITHHVNNGEEDVFVNITSIVEKQISGTLPNYGFAVMLSGSFENGSTTTSYYTKKFSARNSQFFFKRPAIEARWDSSIKDDRDNFYASSSLLDAEDNKYNLYFYNKVKGKYKNIASNPSLTVKFYADQAKTQEVIPSYISVSNPEAGKYKATVSINTVSSSLYDFWVNSASTGTVFFSSSFDVKKVEGYESDDSSEFIFKITNLKDSYKNNETARMKIFSREKNWSPTIYSVANAQVENTKHTNLYYKIFRYTDNYNVIDYSTGSLKYSLTSYDNSGNYFDLDMSIFEPDYLYGIKLAVYENNILKEAREVFKFRVEV